MDTQNENTCYQGFTPNHPEPKSPLDFGQGEQTNQKLLVNLCITYKKSLSHLFIYQQTVVWNVYPFGFQLNNVLLLALEFLFEHKYISVSVED